MNTEEIKSIELESESKHETLNTPLLDALHTYARLLNRPQSRENLKSGLVSGNADVHLDLVKRVLHRVGLSAEVIEINRIPENHLPLCAQLKDGTFVVVSGVDGDEYQLADVTIANAERKIAREQLENQLAGPAILAQPNLEDLQLRHTGLAPTHHWFWGQFRNQKKLLTDIAVASLFANLLAVCVSLFALQVYDRVIPNQSTSSLWVLVVGCVVAIIFEAILKTARSQLMDTSGKEIELNISAFLMERLNGMKLSARSSSPGSLVHAMREFGSVREFFTTSSIGSMADIPFVLLFLTLMYLIAGHVVWIVVLGMLLIVLPSLLLQGRIAKLSEEMLGGTAAAGKLLTELTYAQEYVKAANAEAAFQTKWEEINTLNASKTTEQRSIAAKLSHWAASVQQVTYISTVVAGVYLVFEGESTVGTIIAISILTSRALSPVTQLSGALSRWQLVRSALTGLDAIVNSEQERPNERQFSRQETLIGNIALSKAEFSYGEDHPKTLSIDSLNIEENSNVAILGENGSGKSTLLKVLSGLYSLPSGSISIDGLDLKHIDPVDLRRNIGYLPQEVKLFSGTLRENLLMGIDVYDDIIIRQALDFSGLSKVVAATPVGLDLQISDGGEGMSVGQRHSLALARLFLQDPKIVLLDEPTASLDQNHEAQLVNKLQQWMEGRTCLVATHRVPILALANRIVVLANGKVVMDGPANEIMEQLQAKPRAAKQS